MAEVYQATDLLLDRQVAVKLCAAEQGLVDRQRSMDEGRMLARLSAPGLVTVFDLGLVDDRAYLVMELVDGPSLRDRLLDGPLTVAQTTRLGAPLAGALAHAHERGIVHRDVKPSNVLLDCDGSPKLVDFGIALLADGVRRTAANEIVGTPAYLSPEQVRGDTVGPPTDVYALGLVLLECLTGESAYRGAGWVETAMARLNRPPAIPPGLPVGLADLLTAMTAASPEDRPSAQECAIALRGPRTMPMALGRRRFHWRPGAFVAAAAMVICILVAGVVLTFHPNRPATTEPAMIGEVVGGGATLSTSAVPVVPVPVTTTPLAQANQSGQGQQGGDNAAKKPGKAKGHGH
jgi:serine/threonine protein kinase